MKLYMTDRASQKMWDEDEKDVFLSYQIGSKIAANEILHGDEPLYKSIALELYSVLLNTFDQYYLCYYCRNSEFIRREAFPVLAELTTKLKDIAKKMIELKIVKRDFIPKFIYDPEPLESKNVDFRRLAACCHSLLFELQKSTINRIFMC